MEFMSHILINLSRDMTKILSHAYWLTFANQPFKVQSQIQFFRAVLTFILAVNHDRFKLLIKEFDELINLSIDDINPHTYQQLDEKYTKQVEKTLLKARFEPSIFRRKKCYLASWNIIDHFFQCMPNHHSNLNHNFLFIYFYIFKYIFILNPLSN